MTPEAAQRRERWFARQPNWVREVYYTHGPIHALFDEGFETGRDEAFIWADIARMLLAQTQRDAKTIERLDSIAPRRVRGPDGAEWIYRCPDHLIPVDETAVTPRPVFAK